MDSFKCMIIIIIIIIIEVKLFFMDVCMVSCSDKAQHTYVNMPLSMRQVPLAHATSAQFSPHCSDCTVPNVSTKLLPDEVSTIVLFLVPYTA